MANSTAWTSKYKYWWPAACFDHNTSTICTILNNNQQSTTSFILIIGNSQPNIITNKTPKMKFSQTLTLFAFLGLFVSTFFIELAMANPKMMGAMLLGAALAKRPKMLPFPLPLPIPMKVEHKKYVPYKKPIPYYVHAKPEPIYVDKGYSGGGYGGGYGGGGGGGGGYDGGYGGGDGGYEAGY